MACSTCPGGDAGKQLIENLRRKRVGIMENNANFVPAPKGQQLIFVLYCECNLATHNVASPLRPLTDDGNMVTGYGRRRGATKREIEYVDNNGGVLTVEQASEIGALNKSAFFVHPVDIVAKPDIFRIVDEAVLKHEPKVIEEPNEQAQQLNDEPEDVVDVEVRDDGEFIDLRNMTKKIAADLKGAGYKTYDDLANADPKELAKLIKPTKKLPSIIRATNIIYAAAEALA
jgi:predicted flap endonuclease-1-like 5' DNA nuclease